MSLTGHLSDLSLSELIEFFCNQRKSGQLKVLYPQGRGDFYLHAGSVVDARIGALRGIDAVYYALTLPNANFEFGDSNEPIERTINQPWAQVVLEGLRRLDEGVVPPSAFPPGYSKDRKAPESSPQVASFPEPEHLRPAPAFLSVSSSESTSKRKYFIAAATALAVIGSVAAIGVPAGWYGRTKPTAVVSQPESQSTATAAATSEPSSTVDETPKNELAEPSESTDPGDHGDDAAQAAKRQRDRDKARAREERAGTSNQPTASLPAPASNNGGSVKPGSKKVYVTVTYDESGRVTQASGGDATALRIARQKRFPAGKAGSATITIPMN
jgi:hypothetical protein